MHRRTAWRAIADLSKTVSARNLSLQPQSKAVRIANEQAVYRAALGEPEQTDLEMFRFCF